MLRPRWARLAGLIWSIGLFASTSNVDLSIACTAALWLSGAVALAVIGIESVLWLRGRYEAEDGRLRGGRAIAAWFLLPTLSASLILCVSAGVPLRLRIALSREALVAYAAHAGKPSESSSASPTWVGLFRVYRRVDRASGVTYLETFRDVLASGGLLIYPGHDQMPPRVTSVVVPAFRHGSLGRRPTPRQVR